MQQRKSLSELAAEIERQQSSKRDFVADTRNISIERSGHYLQDDGANPLALVVNSMGRDDDQGFQTSERMTFPLRHLAVKQMAERVKIPAKYANRMADEAPDLLAHNLNHWFRNNPERRMVRTLDGQARAFLSDRYQRIDNVDIASIVLPILSEDPGIKIKSCEITETRMYIQAVTERIWNEVRVGDEVQAGIIISNSEIGFGAVNIQPLVYRLVCDNGMIVPDQRFRKHHVGARADAGEDVFEMLSDEAIKADDQAILLKVRDVVKGALDQAQFDRQVDKMRQAAEDRITGDPVKAVEKMGDTLTLSQKETSSVLTSIIQNGDLSRWGMVNALTEQANTIEDYDRAVDFQAAGGKILDLAPHEWDRIAEAA